MGTRPVPRPDFQYPSRPATRHFATRRITKRVRTRMTFKNSSFCIFQIEVSFTSNEEKKYSELVTQHLSTAELVTKIMTSAKSHLDTALPELIRELGYTFTATVEQCRGNLRQLVGGPDIHAATVA